MSERFKLDFPQTEFSLFNLNMKGYQSRFQFFNLINLINSVDNVLFSIACVAGVERGRG